MALNNKTSDEKLQCDSNTEVAKYHHCHYIKLINMIFLKMEKYYFLIKVK